MIEIETPRLFLRKFQEKDKLDMFEILSEHKRTDIKCVGIFL